MDFIDKVWAKLGEITDVFNLENILYYMAIVPTVLLIEWVVVGWNRSSLKKLFAFRPSTRTDAVYFLLDALNIYNLVTVFITFGAFHVGARLIYEATNFDLVLHIPNPAVQFAVVYVVTDLKNYFSHWVFHKSETLWTLHAFHHSASEFTMLTRYRGHFLETAIKRFFDVLPFALLGVGVKTYVAVRVLNEVHQLFLHSAVKSDWGWVGRWILVSPAAHRLHHSIERKHYGRNFGSTFIFWDRLFGTYAPTEPIAELGVTDAVYNRKGVWHDTVLSVREFLASLRGTRKPG